MLTYGLPLMFGVMGLWFPAGLTVYITTNTLLGIAHTMYMKRSSPLPVKPVVAAKDEAEELPAAKALAKAPGKAPNLPLWALLSLLPSPLLEGNSLSAVAEFFSEVVRLDAKGLGFAELAKDDSPLPRAMAAVLLTSCVSPAKRYLAIRKKQTAPKHTEGW